MEWYESVILGLVQGLTEFLPVSSSGHLEIGKVLLGVETTDDLLFTTMVHAATVLSTIVVFRNQIWDLLTGFFTGLKDWRIVKNEANTIIKRTMMKQTTGWNVSAAIRSTKQNMNLSGRSTKKRNVTKKV